MAGISNSKEKVSRIEPSEMVASSSIRISSSPENSQVSNFRVGASRTLSSSGEP